MTVYDKIAKEFSDSRHYKWPWITDFIEKHTLNTQPTQNTVLDIGCGNGRNIEYYSSIKNKIIGIDNSIEFINICKTKSLEVYLSDMNSLKFKNESIDFILSIASFHHLTNEDDRIKSINEMYRVIKKGGLILLSVWSKNQPSKTKRTLDNYGDTIVPWKSKDGKIYDRYYYIFKIDELVNLIESSGFKILEKKWDCGNEIFIIQK